MEHFRKKQTVDIQDRKLKDKHSFSHLFKKFVKVIPLQNARRAQSIKTT